jgi:hypothetical protein
MSGTFLCVNKPHLSRSYLNHLILTFTVFCLCTYLYCFVVTLLFCVFLCFVVVLLFCVCLFLPVLV